MITFPIWYITHLPTSWAAFTFCSYLPLHLSWVGPQSKSLRRDYCRSLEHPYLYLIKNNMATRDMHVVVMLNVVAYWFQSLVIDVLLEVPPWGRWWRWAWSTHDGMSLSMWTTTAIFSWRRCLCITKSTLVWTCFKTRVVVLSHQHSGKGCFHFFCLVRKLPRYFEVHT